MALSSRLFRAVPALEACLVRDSAHITLGTVGPHVPRIQKALMMIDRVVVDAGEVESMRYGASTAAAVLAYKKKRNIINRSYQTQADNIVGKMTIAMLMRNTVRAAARALHGKAAQEIASRGNVDTGKTRQGQGRALWLWLVDWPDPWASAGGTWGSLARVPNAHCPVSG